ncbi:MAG: hypothetical protein E7309_07250 [Butyrivibrio sp.]|jgi:hypothetical protein|nr:hypothetical protein [Butyrivibrio sp.]
MNKKIVFGVVAGLSVLAGVVVSIVRRSNKRYAVANELIEQTEDILERTINVLEEAEDIFDGYELCEEE